MRGAEQMVSFNEKIQRNTTHVVGWLVPPGELFSVISQHRSAASAEKKAGWLKGKSPKHYSDVVVRSVECIGGAS
jgi:hypothetical protein